MLSGMDAASTTLPSLWFSAGGCDALWGADGTYQGIEYEALPPLAPKLFDGRFGWLPELSVGDDPLDFTNSVPLNPAPILADARALGLTIPPAFLTFITQPELYRRVPTCTACYLDIPSRLIACPGDDRAHLLRFLNDQQACVLWYLYLRADGEHAVACAAPEWVDDSAAAFEDAVRPTNVVRCAPSFEEFVYRF
jgi:hypothetical protein